MVRRLSLSSNVDSFFVSEAAVGRGISLVLRQAIHSISRYHTVSSSLVPSSPSCSICHLNLDHTHSRTSTVRGRVSLKHKRCCFSKLKVNIKILRRPLFLHFVHSACSYKNYCTKPFLGLYKLIIQLITLHYSYGNSFILGCNFTLHYSSRYIFILVCRVGDTITRHLAFGIINFRVK